MFIGLSLRPTKYGVQYPQTRGPSDATSRRDRRVPVSAAVDAPARIVDAAGRAPVAELSPAGTSGVAEADGLDCAGASGGRARAAERSSEGPAVAARVHRPAAKAPRRLPSQTGRERAGAGVADRQSPARERGSGRGTGDRRQLSRRPG